MKKISIKEITISNFRGIKNLKVSPNCENLDIGAETGAGKTSVKDAYLFALGLNIGNYEPLDENNKRINTTTSVSVLFNKGNENSDDLFGENALSIERVSKQKYNSDGEYVSAMSKYYVDGIELTATRYKERVADFFGLDPSYIRVMSDLDFFNSNSSTWGWKNRREFILKVMGIKPNAEDMAEKYPAISMFLLNHTPEEILKAVTTKISEINKRIASINAIIDHTNETISRLGDTDYELYERRKIELYKNENSRTEELRELLSAINKRIDEIVSETRVKARNACWTVENSINEAKNSITILLKNLDFNKSRLDATKMCITASTKKLNETENSVDTVCPSCGKPYTEEEINKIRDTATAQIRDEIAERTALAEELAKKISVIEKKIDEQKRVEQLLSEKRKSFEETSEELLSNNEEFAKLTAVKEEVANNIDSLNGNNYNDWVAEMAEIDKILSNKAILEMAKKENAEYTEGLVANTRDYEKQLERKLQIIDYMAETVERISRAVNEKFDDVSFKFTKEYGANSLKGSDLDCVVLYNGVPYDYCSNGEKILCDFDIVNGLQRHLGVCVPIWIDEAQSCTKPLETVSQKISLYTVANKSL